MKIEAKDGKIFKPLELSMPSSFITNSFPSSINIFSFLFYLLVQTLVSYIVPTFVHCFGTELISATMLVLSKVRAASIAEVRPGGTMKVGVRSEVPYTKTSTENHRPPSPGPYQYADIS